MDVILHNRETATKLFLELLDSMESNMQLLPLWPKIAYC